MTSTVVETETLGHLEFLDGKPLAETAHKVLDNLDTARATIAYVAGVRFATMHATRRGLRNMGVEPGEVAVSKFRLTPCNGIVSPGPAIIGFCSQMHLGNGPAVLEIPPEVKGVVVDAGFRILADIGQSTSTRGCNERHLFWPPGYDGQIPDGYSVAKSPTWQNLVVLIAPMEGDATNSLLNSVKKHVNIYPLGLVDNPPPEIFHCIPVEQFSAPPASDFRFFEDLNAVLQSEPVGALPAELTEVLASIGIIKGHPFEPEQRIIRILNEAAKIGAATALVLANEPNESNAQVPASWSRKLLFSCSGQKVALKLESATSLESARKSDAIQNFCNLAIRS